MQAWKFRTWYSPGHKETRYYTRCAVEPDDSSAWHHNRLDWSTWLALHGLWEKAFGPDLLGLAVMSIQQLELSGQSFGNGIEWFNRISSCLTWTGLDLSRTAAFLIHGDEGRTLKRQAIMVTALQSALGYGFDRKRMGRGGGGPRPLKVNYLGHSFTHRFIISMMPKTVYESAPESFHNAMENVAISLKSLLLWWLSWSNNTWAFQDCDHSCQRGCTISCKGGPSV